MPFDREQLVVLAGHFSQRRDSIMEAWRAKVGADPKLTTGASLPRAQLHDHLPAFLQDFERRLVAGDSTRLAAAVDAQKGDAAAHGLHRWQQGFDLSEVSRELGRLNECVVAELDQCALDHPALGHGAMTEARAVWASLYSVAIESSTARYFELQQIEAAGHISDLEQALGSLRDLELQRAELWQQAAHDLRGNLGVVAMATAGLTSVKASGDARERFLGALDRNVRALHQRLLEDVTSLARLQGGQEVRTLEQMDASGLLRELAEGLQAIAEERGLSLSFEGPAAFVVEGDAIKVRRIVQNLVLNAIKYTQQGGVSVTWGQSTGNDADRWVVQVIDTGPGFHAGGAPLSGALGVATDQAKDVVAGEMSGEVTHVKRAESAIPLTRPADPRPVHRPSGEGIGLSFVKRLCGLLDATLEVDSKDGAGTVFRIRLPRRYAN